MVKRVFWPAKALGNFDPDNKTIAVGWKNSPDDFVVTVILPFLEVGLAGRILEKDELFAGSKNPSDLYGRYDGDKLQVLGTCNHFQPGSYFQVHCTGSLIKRITWSRDDEDPKTHLILYNPPNANWLHYLSLNPIQLAIHSFGKLTVISAEHEADLVAYNEDRKAMKQKIEVSISTANGSRSNVESRRNVLDICISQINCSHELGNLLGKNARKLFPQLMEEEEKRQKRRLSRARQLSISAQSLSIQATQRAKPQFQEIYNVFMRIFIALLLLLNYVCEAVLSILDKRFFVGRASLTSISNTALQIDLMVRRISYFPEQLAIICRRKRLWNTPEFNVEYIRFYNNVWLAFNDRILGYTLGQLILSSKPEITAALRYITQHYLGDAYRENIVWIMSWPGGLKLHTEITVFFGGVVVWVIQSWQLLCDRCEWVLHILILCGAYFGIIGGLTLQIALVCDVISFVTIPYNWFYVSSAKVYRNTLLLFLSLSRLFRGRKYNVLRHRVDHEDYDTSQLFLGTILFTILLFLLPTIAAYYVLFTSTRILVVSVTAFLEVIMTFLNHFPLFILLLRFKSPQRLPGGIEVDFLRVSESHVTFSLSSQPLKLKLIFNQFNVVAHRFVQHYLSWRTFTGLWTGRLVTIERSKFHVILYSTLPRQRKPARQLYQILEEELLWKS